MAFDPKVFMTPYDPEVGDKICAELSEGKSVRTVCTEMGITKTRVFEWLRTNMEFRAQYDRAKEESADALTEEMLDIADDLADEPQSRRVRVDTRKWIASKLKPKKYGDKLDVNNKVDGKIDLSGVVTFVHGKKDKDDDER